jgi:hypothetical protein
MKALCLFLLMFLFMSASSARDPFKAETIELGGSVSYHQYDGKRFQSYDGGGRTEIKLLPDFSFFILDGLSIGAITGYEHAKQGNWTQQTFSVGYRVAYYFLPKSSGSPYAATSYRYGRSKGEYFYYGGSTKSTTRDFAVGIGYLFLINEAIGLTTELDYVSDSIRHEAEPGFYSPSSRRYNGYRWEFLVGFRIFV